MTKQRGTNVVRWNVLTALMIAVAVTFSNVPVAADDFAVETVVQELHTPTGIAVRPPVATGGYEIFIGDAGAGRVIRIASDKPAEVRDAITGFIVSSDVDDPIQLPGPHGLQFLDANRLVVTGGDGKEAFVRLYELKSEDKPLPADQHETQAAPAAEEEQLDDGVRIFQAVARTRANDQVSDFLVLSAVGREGGVGAWRLPVRGGTLGELKILGRESAAMALAVAVEPRGHIVLVRPDRQNADTSSVIEFVHPIDGRTVIEVPVKLPAIVAIAYSPRSGNMYAVSHPSEDSERSGVFRIDAADSADSSKPAATATKIADVVRPTALAFGPDNVLYVTSAGTDGERNRGTLLKITGDF
jgi:hypothetical protein